ncbi:MAG: DUF3800 domain-containing protein [Rubrivivax sp.]
MSLAPPPGRSRSVFVDEAGDPTLFDARGRPLPGQDGCSRHFILGALEVADPGALAAELNELRARLLADPYFRNVPSMQPAQRKTALAFHAKDDLPEVRREVFALLMRHDLKFFAVVRDKLRVLEYVLQRNAIDAAYRYRPNDLYDTLVARLFKNRLHLTPEVDVCFAARGKSDRSAALGQALQKARQRFEHQWARPIEAAVRVRQSTPPQDVSLQAADYFLWALQRHYERAESRFAALVWPKIGVVHAVDETDVAAYGRYYTQKKPLVPGPAAE